jgi:hypothetical protein
MSNEGLEFGDFVVDGDEAVEESVAESVTDEPVAEKVFDEAIEVDDINGEFAGALADAELEERMRLLDEYFPLPEGFPTREQLEAWETEFGRIRIHRIAAHEAYVVRALSRPELRQYLAVLKAKFGKGTTDPTEERMVQEELLVERCTIWPVVTGADVRGERKSDQPINKIGLAGTASILALDIQEISNLIDTNVGPFEEL